LSRPNLTSADYAENRGPRGQNNDNS
jgi:hypothetical protein